MDFLQSEWIVKRRNYAATLNNKGSHIRQEVIFDLFLFFNTFQNLTGQHNRFDLWSENVVATLEIKIFEFFGKDATKNLLFGLSIRLILSVKSPFTLK
jgi:hypothetical protein